ncbi:AP2/ERF domain protein [Vibrio phage 1.152.O._10N.222.46.E1]|uniref:AP2/ERF domain protein n=4 Tax=Nahantvirus 49C7 TaxID=2846601 RepID=A0A2I7RBE8_9CAUD|nr:AP2/ERF domain protein [Vibrio phage 1.025.O._10N.222.46.B6]AUR90771.1 AP2/ERF domain protein [Vibrio phage 1.150.O._10N.222.46.A6]AUR90944.1 AP2/ERF domain protein [Vibrio phage 1.152.O._10N.222.46.E1]AUS02412.1 AP2/ERF domain protein [Vibrio phage 2.130.O._10N.222.46.C2]
MPHVTDIFEYDLKAGYLRTKSTGKLNKHPRATGKHYVKVQHQGTYYQYHNVVWECVNGPIPEGYTVDHIDTNKLNNNISNLRLATPAEQTHNTKSYGKTSTFKGVDFNANAGKWFSRIYYEGKSYWLGSYDTEIEAAKAYKTKATELHGDFKHDSI